MFNHDELFAMQTLFAFAAFANEEGGGDSTPGGTNNVLLLQSGEGILMQDGSSFFLIQ